MVEALLRVTDLVAEFPTPRGVVRPLANVGLCLDQGDTLGVVGESGSGKSMLALSLMGLLPAAGRVVSGSVRYQGRELVGLPDGALQQVRGRELGLVFQEPMSALNPVYTVGAQIMEPLRVHLKLGRAQARARAIELLAQVGIPAASSRVDAYPHELSGGMRQRVMIALAISCNPRVLIADEPTTALDVTIQAQVLDLLADLQSSCGMGIILITHDLGVVAEFVERVMVMYAGRVVEQARTEQLFADPLHPYTRGLLNSIPTAGRRRLYTIEGTVPDLARLPGGCRFRARCERAEPVCAGSEPELYTLPDGRAVACFVAAREQGLRAEEGGQA